MPETPICAFPTASTPKASGTVYPAVAPGTVGTSSLEKVIPSSPHAALPSTSSAPLFYASHLISPPAIQAMANSLFSQTPFFNSFNPLSFASPPDLTRVQQWFQNNSPYTSPSPSTTPSLVSNLSGLSILSTDSSFTLNSQQLNTKFGKTDGTLDSKMLLDNFLETFKLLETDQDMFLRSFRAFKIFSQAIVSKKIQEFDQKKFCELINMLIDQLAKLKEQKLINAILDILYILYDQHQFEMAITERKTPALVPFTEHFLRIVSSLEANDNHQLKALHSILSIIYRCFAVLKDKSKYSIRTEKFFDAILQVLRINGKSAIKYIAIGILRCLIYREDRWKHYIYERGVVELIISLIKDKRESRKIFYQALNFLNVLFVSKDVLPSANKFVKLGGIDILMQKVTSGLISTEEHCSKLVKCLKLVSDGIENTPHAHELSLAIIFSLKATFPPSESPSKLYLNTIVDALGFLCNAAMLNEHARNYLASLEECRAVQHIVDIAYQCIDETIPENAEGELMNKLKQMMLEYCLAILAALIKEMPSDGTLTEGQKKAAKKLSSNKNIMHVYQYILKTDTVVNTYECQKSVLLILCRITKAEAMPISSPGLYLADTLLNFLFTRFDSTTSIKQQKFKLLLKMAATVIHRIIASPDRSHLASITSLMINGMFQPFDLLRSITNDSNLDSDLYLGVLKIVKELCKREPILKSQWSSIANVQFLSSNSTISSNSEIAYLCTEVLEMLQMGEDQFEGSSMCEIFGSSMTDFVKL